MARRLSPVRAGALALVGALILATANGAALAETSDTVGDALRIALPAAALALTIKRDDREGRRQLYRAFAANVGATWALKEVVKKERPDGTGDDAFPSGHASVAFQAAAFIHRRYGFRSAWPAYALATVTAWTRLDIDEHDEADVLAGAALGIASSFVLVDRRDVAVTPAFAPGYMGVSVAGNFGGARR